MFDAILSAGKARNGVSVFARMLEDARKWKPEGYDKIVSKRRDYYRGDQVAWVLGDLQRRYPETWQHLSPYCTPLIRHLIEQQATVWKSPPRRTATADQQRLDSLYSESSVDAHLQHAEEVAVAAGVAFLRVSWDPIDARPFIDIYWPDKIDVVCSAERPDRLDMAEVVIASLVSAGSIRGKGDRFEVWTREGDTWKRSDVRDSGALWIDDPQVYKRLPFVALYPGRSEGVMFSTPASDDIEVANAVNAMWSDLCWTIAMQSGPQVTYTGRDAGKILQSGPHSVWSATDGQFGVLNFQPVISQVKEVVRDMVAQLLVLRGVSPAHATADPAYMAAVTIKVLSGPMLEKRAARIPFAREFEELRLWPLLRDVYESGIGQRFPAGTKMGWQPGELQLPLDDEAEMRVLQGQIAMGMTTVEDAMVKRGFARDLFDAEQRRAANLESAKKFPMDWGVPFIKGETPAGPAEGEE